MCLPLFIYLFIYLFTYRIYILSQRSSRILIVKTFLALVKIVKNVIPFKLGYKTILTVKNARIACYRTTLILLIGLNFALTKYTLFH